MKLSRYNWLVEYKDVLIAYNGVTGAITKVFKKDSNEIRELFSRSLSEGIDPDDISPHLLDPLIECGFIVPNDFDERDYLHVVSQTFRYSPLIRSITAVITTSCNFECEYCYQQNGRLSQDIGMTEEVICKIAEIAGESSADLFSLCLYGGEPLLYSEKCIDLCEKISAARKQNSRSFKASLITNGYYLTSEIARSLRDAGVRYAQVTIDGDRATHDSRRPLKGGGPTYDTIMENINEASEYLEIALRVNVDYGIEPHLNQLREMFSESERIAVYAAATKYDYCDQPERSMRNLQYIDELGIPAVSRRKKRLEVKIPGCGAVSLGSFVVMPDGRQVKCWSEVEGGLFISEHSNILETRDDPLKACYKWMVWDPFSPDMKCFECKMLPHCGGGCPADYFKDGEPRCLQTEETFRECIIENYLEELEKGEQDESADTLRQ